MEENLEKAEQQTDRFKDDHKLIKQWARSSGAGLARTNSGRDNHQYSVHNSKKDLLLETAPSSLGDSYVKRSYVPKYPNSSRNPIPSPKSSKRMDISAYEPCVTRDQPPLREREGFLPTRNLKQLRRDDTSSPIKKSDAPATRSEPSYSHRGFSSKARKLSSLRKNLSSVRQTSVVESKFSFKKKCSARKKSQVHFISDLDEDEVACPSKVDRRTSLFRHGKKRGAVEISRKEEGSDLKSSLSPPPQCYDRGSAETTDNFSFRACSDSEFTSDDEEFARKEVQKPGEHIIEGSFMSLNKSLDPEFHKLSNPPDAEYEGPIGTMEQSLGDAKETFCSDEIGQTSHMVAEIDSRGWQRNYFSDVNAISIPGPPGSFLPSLEDLGSEDLQGNNSSLTTSRVQSSEDHQDIVYRDSSDSLVSATSNISNPSVAGSDSRSSENFPVQPHVVQDEIRQLENCAPVNLVAERLDDLRVNAIFPEKRSVGLRNDQPCCCSRKESASPGGPALNYQDSQLLRRWTMASVQPPPIGKQWVSSDPNKGLGTSNSRTEMFSLNNFSISSGSENAVLSGMKSPAGPNIPIKVSVDSEVKFPTDDSASPSAAYPVLRLMGKNLMVVNKDEDLPLQQRQSMGSISISRQNSQHFDDRFSNNFVSHVDSNTLLHHASRVPSKTAAGGGGGGFTASLERHKYEGGIQFAN